MHGDACKESSRCQHPNGVAGPFAPPTDRLSGKNPDSQRISTLAFIPCNFLHREEIPRTLLFSKQRHSKSHLVTATEGTGKLPSLQLDVQPHTCHGSVSPRAPRDQSEVDGQQETRMGKEAMEKDTSRVC